MDIDMERSGVELGESDKQHGSKAEKDKEKSQQKIQQPPQIQESLGLSSSSPWMTKLLSSLSKAQQNRSGKQMDMIMEFARDSKCLGQIMEKVSSNFVKSLINNKSKQVIRFEAGTVLAKQGQKISHFYFLIDGKLAKSKDISTIPALEEVFEKLGLAASKEIKQLSRVKKKPDSLNSSNKNIQKKYLKITEKQFSNLELVSEEKYKCGVEDRALGIKHNCTVVTMEDSWVLVIPEKQFLTSMHTLMNEKIKKFMEKIRDISCFRDQQTQKLQTFILSLSERNKSRGCEIYRQNDPASHIYFLTKGEIKLTKNSNLFQQNPNDLYVNRLKIFDLDTSSTNKQKPRYEIQEEEMKKKQAILPYADFSLMYNFHPKKKNIQICKMEAFCLFGEEEHIQNKNRDSTATCNSLQVTYFQVSMKRIQEIFGTKAMPTFIKGLKQTTKQKVKKRQQNYANSIHFENQANMKYFYYEGDKEALTSRKFRITKINNKLDIPSQSNPTKNMSNNANNKNEQGKKIIKNGQMSPFYTTFNFNELKPGTTALRNSRVSQLRESTAGIKFQKNKNTLEQYDVSSSDVISSKISRNYKNNGQRSQIRERGGQKDGNIKNYQSLGGEQIKKGAKHVQNQQDEDEAGDQYLNTNIKPAEEEMVMMNMTHTWKLIKKKVDAQLAKSQRTSPTKFKIDIGEPLIGNKFLMDLEKEKKRVERKLRKDKITLTPRTEAQEARRMSLRYH